MRPPNSGDFSLIRTLRQAIYDAVESLTLPYPAPQLAPPKGAHLLAGMGALPMSWLAIS